MRAAESRDSVVGGCGKLGKPTRAGKPARPPMLAMDECPWTLTRDAADAGEPRGVGGDARVDA